MRAEYKPNLNSVNPNYESHFDRTWLYALTSQQATPDTLASASRDVVYALRCDIPGHDKGSGQADVARSGPHG